MVFLLQQPCAVAVIISVLVWQHMYLRSLSCSTAPVWAAWFCCSPALSGCRNKHSSIGSASKQSWSLRPGNMDDSSSALLRASEYHRERSRLQVCAEAPCCKPVLELCNVNGIVHGTAASSACAVLYATDFKWRSWLRVCSLQPLYTAC